MAGAKSIPANPSSTCMARVADEKCFSNSIMGIDMAQVSPVELVELESETGRSERD